MIIKNVIVLLPGGFELGIPARAGVGRRIPWVCLANSLQAFLSGASYLVCDLPLRPVGKTQRTG